jgi:hypothetical protein
MVVVDQDAAVGTGFMLERGAIRTGTRAAVHENNIIGLQRARVRAR